FRYELVKGELRQMAPASHEHGRITINISTPLDQRVRANNLGVVFAAETGFRLASAPDTVRAPDVAFISLSRYQQADEVTGYWPGAPDLVIEVVSPGDSYTEVQEKVIEWLEAGALTVVVVSPRKRIVTVYRSLKDVVVLRPGETLELPDTVPGFSLPLEAIFG
ncbi:MAG TPA: Uma2 family endonuclease, partial [Blastocatellia bacterium]